MRLGAHASGLSLGVVGLESVTDMYWSDASANDKTRTDIYAGNGNLVDFDDKEHAFFGRALETGDVVSFRLEPERNALRIALNGTWHFAAIPLLPGRERTWYPYFAVYEKGCSFSLV